MLWMCWLPLILCAPMRHFAKSFMCTAVKLFSVFQQEKKHDKMADDAKFEF